jgi:hypothetical protein
MSTTGYDPISGYGQGFNGVGQGFQGLSGGDPTAMYNTPIYGSPAYGPGSTMNPGGAGSTGVATTPSQMLPIDPVGGLRSPLGGSQLAPRGNAGYGSPQGIKPMLTQLFGQLFQPPHQFQAQRQMGAHRLPQRPAQPQRAAGNQLRPVSRPAPPRPVTGGPVRSQNPPSTGGQQMHPMTGGTATR